MNLNSCSSSSVDRATLEVALSRVTAFLRCYLPLGNAHANDFLVFNSWERVIGPPTLRAELEDTVDLLDIPRTFLDTRAALLTSPARRKAALAKLDSPEVQEALEPHPVTFTSSGDSDKLSNPSWIHTSLVEFTEAAATCSLEVLLNLQEDESTTSEGGVQSGLEDAFVSHGMTPKKAHEIELMSRQCGQMCRELSLDQVVDIGSGKGYLGTYLHLAHRLSVIEIDSQSSNSQGSVRRRDSLLVKWPHLLTRARATSANKEGAAPVQPGSAANERTPEAACLALTAMITSSEQLDDIVKEYTTADDDSEKNCLLTGLHTCGGLASVCLRTFTHSARSRALINLGCCYHLLEEAHFRNPFLPPEAASECPQEMPLVPADFPMSAWLLGLGERTGRPPFALGRNARIIASQSLERIVDTEDDRPLHVSMFHRVLVQRILLDHLGYTLDSWVVGRLGRKCSDYLSYTRACLSKLGFNELQDQLTDATVMSYLDKYASTEHRLFAFYLLRCLLAPAIEACIILDRLLYLCEQRQDTSANFSVQILPMFHAKLSPRRFAIVAVKN